MITERLPIIHPGEILKLDFLEPMNITPYRLSVDIGVAQTRMSEIINGKRGISAVASHSFVMHHVRIIKSFTTMPQKERIIYVTTVRFHSERAHALYTALVLDSFAALGHAVTAVVDLLFISVQKFKPRAKNTPLKTP